MSTCVACTYNIRLLKKYSARRYRRRQLVDAFNRLTAQPITRLVVYAFTARIIVADVGEKLTHIPE